MWRSLCLLAVLGSQGIVVKCTAAIFLVRLITRPFSNCLWRVHTSAASDAGEGLRLRLRHFHSHLEVCEANARARCAQEKVHFPFSLRLRQVPFTLVFTALAQA